MKKTLLIASLLFAANTFSKEDATVASDTLCEYPDMIIQPIWKAASFPGGKGALVQFLSENIKYPPTADGHYIGRVIVEFVVEKDGSISNITVIKSVHPLLDEEAVRVVKLMPKWQPGEQGGEAVRSKFRLPVIFNF